MNELPKSSDVSELRRIFQAVWDALRPWLTATLVDLNGRRIGNAGAAISPRDYVTLGQAEAAFAKAQHQHDAPADRTIGAVRIGTFATRGLPAAWSGTFFEASDQNYVGWASNGSAWLYSYGYNLRTQSQLAALAALLGANDANYLVSVTDYLHELRWTGSAWEFAPGDNGSGYSVFADAAPQGGLWQVWDGSTVNRLNGAGTVTSVTVPDVSTARYMKAGTTYIAPAASSGTTAGTVATNQAASAGTPAGTNSAPTFTGDSVNTGPESATQEVFSGVGVTVADSPHVHSVTATGTVSAPTFTGSALATHNHTQDSHTHAPGTQELSRVQVIGYYRR